MSSQIGDSSSFFIISWLVSNVIIASEGIYDKVSPFILTKSSSICLLSSKLIYWESLSLLSSSIWLSGKLSILCYWISFYFGLISIRSTSTSPHLFKSAIFLKVSLIRTLTGSEFWQIAMYSSEFNLYPFSSLFPFKGIIFVLERDLSGP